MFLSHKKGIALDGGNPTLLYGYGGFDISLTPRFLTSRVWWLEQGGVLAVANLRGGGEYGEAWHKAGTKTNKQNVFDDFIAAVRLADRQQLHSQGEACDPGSEQRRPSRGRCFDAAAGPVCRGAPGCRSEWTCSAFTSSRRGRYWTDDYGSSDNPEEFKALHAYSPYHNIKRGTCYPPTFVTTADTDDRVVPGHSFKFIARLQAAQDCPKAVLARIETRAGARERQAYFKANRRSRGRVGVPGAEPGDEGLEGLGINPGGANPAKPIISSPALTAPVAFICAGCPCRLVQPAGRLRRDRGRNLLHR